MTELSIYIVSRADTGFTVLFDNGQAPRLLLDKSYLNPMYAGARVLYEHLVRTFSEQEWAGMTYMYDKQFKNLLRHATMNSFFFKGDMFVPAPNLEFSDELHPAPDLAALLENALALATPCEASTEAEFVSFTQHADPDYAAICLQDFDIWNGVMEAVNVGGFKRGVERWNCYYLPRGDVPNIEEMPSLKGLVLSGGMYSMSDLSLPWRQTLLDLIVQAYNSGRVKIVGLCLGHQAAAEALGGKTGPNPSNEFIYTLEFCSSLQDNFLGDYYTAEIHGQCVLKPPEDLLVLHTSKSATVESMYKPGKLLTTQGHVEMTSYLLQNFYNDRMLSKGVITQEVYDRLNADPQEADSEALLEKVNRFLRDPSL